MKGEKLSQTLANKLSRISACGFVLVITTFSGLYFGIYLDKVTNMAPNFTLVLLITGIVLGFRGFIQETINQRKETP